MERNFRLIVAYDGTRYFGWEHQKTEKNTIQGKLESVLARMLLSGGRDQIPDPLDPEKCISPSDLPEKFLPEVTVTGAGRTDAGVHARAQTANVHLDTPLSEEEIRAYLNRYLPEDIGVSEVKQVSDRFHARFSATGKTYRYTFYTGPQKPVFERRYVTVLDRTPDLTRMREAAALLTGTHDFKSFCGNPNMKKSTIRTVDSIEILRNGPYLRLNFHGDGFLQHMVRILSGTLLEAGYGKRAPEDMTAVLAARSRSAAGFTAPAQGLCLMKVDYQ